ncbi:MAG TPA: non-heme iron oxygenase ferredoxin subunit [Candidatus Acidoferrales bacterium]
MSRFVKVASVDQIDSERGALVECEGKRIALFNVTDRYYAIEDTCTHRGGPLSEGMLLEAEGVVVCPWHGARFDIKTGKVLGPPAPQGVASFPVRVVGKDIEVEMPEAMGAAED